METDAAPDVPRRQPKQWPSRPCLVLCVMYFLSSALFVSWTCSLVFVSASPLVPPRLKTLHVAVCCVGSLVFYPVAASYLFQLYLTKANVVEAQVTWLLTMGMGPTFLLSDVPRFIIEMHIVWEYGFSSSVVQTVSLILTATATGIGFFMIWVLVLWQYVGYLQREYLKDHQQQPETQSARAQPRQQQNIYRNAPLRPLPSPPSGVRRLNNPPRESFPRR